MKKFKLSKAVGTALVGMALTISFTACGGGGGGSSSNYTGVNNNEGGGSKPEDDNKTSGKIPGNDDSSPKVSSGSFSISGKASL